MAEKIKVMAARQDNMVILWETHPDHVSKDNPTGEVFISGDGQSYEVGLTREVQKRLTDGRLVKVNTGPTSWLDKEPKPEEASTTKKAKGGD